MDIKYNELINFLADNTVIEVTAKDKTLYILTKFYRVEIDFFNKIDLSIFSGNEIWYIIFRYIVFDKENIMCYKIIEL